jgi:transposase
MDVVYKQCCGIDIHKNMLMVCVFTSVRKKEIREFGTMTDDILELVSWIKETNCEVVAMESTGVYWKPVYNILESEGINIIVVNAQHIKGVPGRKTDVKDSEWIADLVRHGLVKASYIPNRDQREQREITRYRQELVEERARELNRIQAVLEGANIKLGSVITDISGKTGISILKAIVNGITDPIVLSELAKGKATNKIAELRKALKGSVGTHQMQMLKHQIEHIEFISNVVLELDEEIKKKMQFSSQHIELLDEMPGIGVRSAERIVAETGINMEQFVNADHFCSWSGIVPQCNESAGKKKSTRIRKGNKFLKSTIVECARAAIRCKNSYFYAKYNKIVSRRGGNRALIAVAHSMLLAIYHILKDKQHFKDLGSNYFTTMNSEKIKNRNIKSLESLGFHVDLMPQT